MGKEVTVCKWASPHVKDTVFHLVPGSLSFSFSFLMTFSSSPLWAYFDDILQIAVHNVLRVGKRLACTAQVQGAFERTLLTRSQ